jgi:ubiquinone/menaquinone biosynthesis C-methylase UbiE
MNTVMENEQKLSATNRDEVIKEAFERPQWYLTKTAYNIRVRIETIKEFLGDRKPDNILDIGCGDGSLSLHLLAKSNRITLLDRSTSMLKIAKCSVSAEAQERVTIVNDAFMTAPLAEKSFDMILCVGVMAYVDDRRAFVKKIVSLLKPGGTLIMECTDGSHPVTYAIRGYAALRRPLVSDKFKTITKPSKDLLAICKDLGFKRLGGFRYSLPLPGLRKFLSQGFSQRAIRFLYGNSKHNRLPWLGNECIYHFVYTN